jgi:hypothetical protein
MLRHLDPVVAGRYDHRRRLQHGLASAFNRRMGYLTQRYAREDVQTAPRRAWIIGADGTVIASGVAPG